jgi:two-component system, NarL family, invasion response regulator UvrY
VCPRVRAVSSIYIVDDHALFRDGLRAVLRGAHQVVGEAASAAQALPEIEQLAPAIVLLDLNLGAHSGFELLAQLQARPLPTRTIALTMSAQPHHVAQALRLGAFGYVLKGASVADLLVAIDGVLRGARQLSADIAALTAQGQAGPNANPNDMLSAREHEILMLVVQGKSSARIGGMLGLSPKTVDSYRSRLMAKLGVANLPELVRYAVRAGLIDRDA